MALSAAALIATAALAGAAHAGPATGAASGAVNCTASAPDRGAEVSGPILHVIDGRTFCLAEGPTPASWLKVTLAGAADTADRSDLMAAAFARRVTCVVYQRGDDGVLARCSVGPPGASLGPAPASRTSGEVNAANCPKPD